MNLLKGTSLVKRANLFTAVFGINTSKLLCCDSQYLLCNHYLYRPKCNKVGRLDGTENRTVLHHSRSYSQNLLHRIYEYVDDKAFTFRRFNDRNRLALFLYGTIDTVDFEEFYRFLELPDTFNSWFVIVELHVWMLMSQVMDQKSGIKLRNTIVKMMWLDVEVRLGNIGSVNTKILKKQLKELYGRLNVTLWTYDEGLLGTDTVLAGALWYKFFDKHCDDPIKLEVLVSYVRQQVQHLSSLELKDYKRAREIKNMWIPFKNHVKAVLDK